MDIFTLVTLCALAGLLITGLVITVVELLERSCERTTEQQRRILSERAKHRARVLRRLDREV